MQAEIFAEKCSLGSNTKFSTSGQIYFRCHIRKWRTSFLNVLCHKKFTIHPIGINLENYLGPDVAITHILRSKKYCGFYLFKNVVFKFLTIYFSLLLKYFMLWSLQKRTSKYFESLFDLEQFWGKVKKASGFKIQYVAYQHYPYEKLNIFQTKLILF